MNWSSALGVMNPGEIYQVASDCRSIEPGARQVPVALKPSFHPSFAAITLWQISMQVWSTSRFTYHWNNLSTALFSTTCKEHAAWPVSKTEDTRNEWFIATWVRKTAKHTSPQSLGIASPIIQSTPIGAIHRNPKPTPDFCQPLLEGMLSTSLLFIASSNCQSNFQFRLL